MRLIVATTAEADAYQAEAKQADDVARRFHDVTTALADLDDDRAWQAGTDQERRVLLEEFLESVTVLPDHRDVTVRGAPRINVLLSEVGLKNSKSGGVGGGSFSAVERERPRSGTFHGCAPCRQGTPPPLAEAYLLPGVERARGW